MKKARFTEEQIAFALRQAETCVAEVRRRKQLVADLSLDRAIDMPPRFVPRAMLAQRWFPGIDEAGGA